MTSTESRRPLLPASLRWFMLAMILANTAGQMAYSLLSLYMVEMGATVGQVGMVFTVASLVPTALLIFGGWLSDTIGRLRAIAIGSAISTLGYLLIVVSPSWEWVMLGLSIEYVSSSVVGPSFGAYIADQSTEEQRGRVFGLTQSIFLTVTVIGPALAGFLAYRFSFRLMLLVSLVLYASATVLRLWMASSPRFAPTRAPTRPSMSGLKTEIGAMFALLVAGGILTWIWVTDAVRDVAFNLIGQIYPIYLSDVGKMNLEQIGLLNAAWGVATIFAAYAAGWVSDRYGERVCIVSGFLVEALGLAILLQARSFAGFMAAMFTFGMGAGSLMPAYNALISKAVPEERRGLAYGLFGTSLGILSLPFPWVGAQLWERFGPQTPFWFTVAGCIISIPIAWYKFVLPAKGNREPDESP